MCGDGILLVNTEIAGKWMSIPEKMVLIWTVRQGGFLKCGYPPNHAQLYRPL